MICWGILNMNTNRWLMADLLMSDLFRFFSAFNLTIILSLKIQVSDPPQRTSYNDVLHCFLAKTNYIYKKAPIFTGAFYVVF
jgi:hypothetical protein